MPSSKNAGSLPRLLECISKCAVTVVQWNEDTNSDLVASKLGHIFACPASWRCPLYLFPFSMVLPLVINYYKKLSYTNLKECKCIFLSKVDHTIYIEYSNYISMWKTLNLVIIVPKIKYSIKVYFKVKSVSN